MARIPPIKRLTTEDFKDQTAWIGKLLSPLNEFMAAVSQSLSRGLTFEDNMSAQVKELTFTVGADTFPMKFQSTLSQKPRGLWVVSAREVASTPSTLTTAVFADWDFNTGQIILNNISGLTSGKKYYICVIIITG